MATLVYWIGWAGIACLVALVCIFSWYLAPLGLSPGERISDDQSD